MYSKVFGDTPSLRYIEAFKIKFVYSHPNSKSQSEFQIHMKDLKSIVHEGETDVIVFITEFDSKIFSRRISFIFNIHHKVWIMAIVKVIFFENKKCLMQSQIGLEVEPKHLEIREIPESH